MPEGNDAMKWKIGYGAKANVANALLQSIIDAGDLIVTSDSGKEQIGFVKPDGSVAWMKAIRGGAGEQRSGG